MAQITSATINPLPHAPSSLQHQDEAGLVLGRGRKGTKAVLEPEAVGPLMETPRSLPLYSDPSQLPMSPISRSRNSVSRELLSMYVF